MGDAVFSICLRRGNFIIALKDQLSVFNIVKRIRAPIFGIIDTASWTAASAPFIREEDFRPIIIERRRMPIGKSRIDNFINACGLERIRDVENNTIS
jgi:hypothetical protein